MTAIRFCVPLSPVSVNQGYRVGRGRMFKSPAAVAYQQGIALAGKRAMRGKEPMTGSLEVRLLFVYSTERNDIDGAIKPTLDAMQGSVYGNDRQVRALKVAKHKDPEAPRVEIEVVEVTP